MVAGFQNGERHFEGRVSFVYFVVDLNFLRLRTRYPAKQLVTNRGFSPQ